MEEEGEVGGGFWGQAVVLEAHVVAQRVGGFPAVAEPGGVNRVERDSLHEVQPARAGAAAHGKPTADRRPEG